MSPPQRKVRWRTSDLLGLQAIQSTLSIRQTQSISVDQKVSIIDYSSDFFNHVAGILLK